MKIRRLIVAVAFFVSPLSVGAQAQQDWATPYYPPSQQTPQSWSYDPYTSGLGPCPQKSPWDLQPCSKLMPPTYGQPSYWPR